MKNSARLLASLPFLAIAFTTTSARADNIDSLYDDVIAFKNNYMTGLTNIAKKGSAKDKVAVAELKSGIELGCGEFTESKIPTPDFLKTCLKVIQEGDRKFNVQGVFDLTEHNSLSKRVAAFVPDDNPAPSIGKGRISSPSDNKTGEFSYTHVFKDISAGCPGSFTNFNNIISPTCVATQTEALIKISRAYAQEAKESGVYLSSPFHRYCLEKMDVEINTPENPHGPWYNELEDITQCVNRMQAEINSSFSPSTDVVTAHKLIRDMVINYENEYEREYPHEWRSPHKNKNVGRELNTLFTRNPV